MLDTNVRSVFLLLATLCLLGSAPRPRAAREVTEPASQPQLASASPAPALAAKLAPAGGANASFQRDRRDALQRDLGAPIFVVTTATPPLVEPPRVALPGAPGMPSLPVVSPAPSRSSRGPPR